LKESKTSSASQIYDTMLISYLLDNQGTKIVVESRVGDTTRGVVETVVWVGVLSMINMEVMGGFAHVVRDFGTYWGACGTLVSDCVVQSYGRCVSV